MGFFDRLFGKKTRQRPVTTVAANLPLPVADVESETNTERPQFAKLKRIANPVLAFKTRNGIGEFEQPEYDIAEDGRIEDVESIVALAFARKDGLMFKEGFDFVGKNPTTIKYIKQRFEQIGQVSGIPLYQVAKGIAEDLIRLHNAFVIKVRDSKASGGKLRKKLGTKTTLEPVAGYFLAPVSTIRFKRNDYGQVLKYQQMMPDGKYQEFSPDNVIHFFMGRKKGFLIGTPPLVSVKDDIRALRRIEENIEMLVYQNLFPLYQYVVGTEEHPAGVLPDGTREIDAVKGEIEIMPAEGMLVTPERHEIKAIGSEGRALRAEAYLKYFRERLIAGLGISSIDLGIGETANRSTADNLSRNLVDSVKHYQLVFEAFFNEYIIKELLLESTFPDPLSDENLVRIKFNEIDLDAKIKVQNHALNAFKGYAITHNELRREFGAEPFNEEDWNDTFWKRIEEPKALIMASDEPFSAASQALARNENTSIEPEDLETEQAGRDREIAKTGKAPSGGGTPGRKTDPGKANGGQKAAQAGSTPSNQHGTNPSPRKRQSMLHDMVAQGNTVTNTYRDLLHSMMNSLTAGTFTLDWANQLIQATQTIMVNQLSRSMRIKFREGYRQVLHNATVVIPGTLLDDRAARFVKLLLTTLLTQIKDIYRPDQIDEIKSKLVVVFDSLEYRTRFIYNSECKRAENYGIISAMRTTGQTEFQVVLSNDACEECAKYNDTIFQIKYATLDNVPPFHTNCECKIKRR